MGLMLIGCCFCTVLLLFQPSVPLGVLLLGGGRMFIEASYAALWTYTPEAYPTTIRATGLGVANAWSKVASIITPFVRRRNRPQGLSDPTHRSLRRF